MSPEDEIRCMLERSAQAVRDKDAKAAVAFLADDVTAYLQPPPLEVTGNKARDPAGMQAWFDTWEGPIGLDTPDLVVRACGDCGYAYGLTRMSGTKKGASKASEIWFRHTFCVRKIDGLWKIENEHESVPYTMDGTQKALLNLKPGDTIDANEAVGKTQP